MLNLFHIDLVVVSVRTDPLDPQDAFLEIDGHDETIVVPLHIEHDAICRNDTGSRVVALHVGCARPPGLPRFVEPGIEGSLERFVVLVPSPCLDELP